MEVWNMLHHQFCYAPYWPEWLFMYGNHTELLAMQIILKSFVKMDNCLFVHNGARNQRMCTLSFDDHSQGIINTTSFINNSAAQRGKRVVAWLWYHKGEACQSHIIKLTVYYPAHSDWRASLINQDESCLRTGWIFAHRPVIHCCDRMWNG